MKLSKRERAKLLVVLAYAEKCKRDFSYFFRESWGAINANPLVWNWHLDAICQHAQAVFDFYCGRKELSFENRWKIKGPIKELVINTPPRTTKSQIISVFFNAWVWAKCPQVRFLLGTAVEDVAMRDSVLVHEVVESHWFQNTFFPDWGWRKDQDAKGFFKTSLGGHRITKTTGARCVGIDGDFLLVDDPLDTANIFYTKKDLEYHIDWHEISFKSRETSPGNTPEIIIMQRIHEDDLGGKCIGKGYDSLVLPAIFEGEQKSTTGFVDPRKPGESIDPRRLDLNFLEKKRVDLGDRFFDAIYQQNPTSEAGTFFAEGDFRYYNFHNLPESFDHVVSSWDTAFKKGTKTDFVAGQVWGRKGANYWLLYRVKRRMSVPEAIAAIRGVAKSFPNAYAHLIEIQSTGKKICNILSAEIPGVIGVDSYGSTKEERANEITPIVSAGQIYLPHPTIAPWIQKEFLPEITGFPHKKHDDELDAFTQAIGWAKNNLVIGDYSASMS